MDKAHEHRSEGSTKRVPQHSPARIRRIPLHAISAASLGAWDIIGISHRDVVLCQVKTRDWPGSVEMETLHEFVAPSSCRKIVHRWRHRQHRPDVKEL